MAHHTVAAKKELNSSVKLPALQSVHKSFSRNSVCEQEICQIIDFGVSQSENPRFFADFELIQLRVCWELANKLDMSRHWRAEIRRFPLSRGMERSMDRLR